MKLGVRLTLLIAVALAATLGVSAWLLVRLRRAELERALAERAQERAGLAARALGPVVADAADRPPGELLAALEAARAPLAPELAPFTVDHLAVAPGRPSDPGWAQLFEAAAIERRPAGRLFRPDGRAPFFAIAVPVGGSAFAGLRAEASGVDAAARAYALRLVPGLAALVAGFALLVYLVLLRSVVHPLRRLNDGIAAVAEGDLSRALLPERNDEIGALAARFNRMTESLREARAAQAHAVESRHALETRVRHAEKLATMGQLAAQIAHELGTPLSVIGGRARTLARRAADPAEVRKNAEIVATQVDRITRIIRQVLTFSRKSRPTLTQVDVAQVVRESLDLLAETIARQRVRTRLELAAGLPAVPGDPGEIQQVCLNLIHNALHAMPGGGDLTVRLASVLQRKGGLDHAVPSPYLLLELRDTGPGVPPELRERVFEPFFTTKDSGEGTGLGLAVSKGIVTDHDGWIEVGGEPGHGAVFRVYLPMQPETAVELGITHP